MRSPLFPFLRRDLLARLRFRLWQARAGYGRPLSPAVADREFTSGAWEHFQQLPELARYAVLAATTHALHPHGRVLDLGCGNGQQARLLHPYRPQHYTGVDFSPAGIRQACALGLADCEFLVADFETWRPREPQDAILLGECLGYARDPGALVAAFLPHLAPGGHILASLLRFGHAQAQWHRVERHTRLVEHTQITNLRGQTWDLKVLAPR